jgi:hypothetical protein
MVLSIVEVAAKEQDGSRQDDPEATEDERLKEEEEEEEEKTWRRRGREQHVERCGAREQLCRQLGKRHGRREEGEDSAQQHFSEALDDLAATFSSVSAHPSRA